MAGVEHGSDRHKIILFLYQNRPIWYTTLLNTLLLFP